MGSIAGDTKTLSTNVLESELEALKESEIRKRFSSVSDLVRYAIHEVARVEDPILALKWEEARLKRWAVNASVLVVGAAAVFQVTVGSSKIERIRPRLARPSIRQIARQQRESFIAV